MTIITIMKIMLLKLIIICFVFRAFCFAIQWGNIFSEKYVIWLHVKKYKMTNALSSETIYVLKVIIPVLLLKQLPEDLPRKLQNEKYI